MPKKEATFRSSSAAAKTITTKNDESSQCPVIDWSLLSCTSSHLKHSLKCISEFQIRCAYTQTFPRPGLSIEALLKSLGSRMLLTTLHMAVGVAGSHSAH